MSKSGVLLPEPFPDWLTGLYVPPRGSRARLNGSPNIIERIESFLGAESSEVAQSFNQCLVNEYQADQGISVRLVKYSFSYSGAADK